MNYYSAWTISSVAKLVTEALRKTGGAGAYILVGGTAIGGYLAYRKMKDLERRIDTLQYKVHILEGKNGR